LTWFNAEPNADPALTAAVPEFAFSKADSAAAWAKAEARGKAIARVKIIAKRMRLFMCNTSTLTQNSSPEPVGKQGYS
jgi:hypothetical protein